jgi:hypothetical protein
MFAKKVVNTSIQIPAAVTYIGAQINEPFHLDILVGDAPIIWATLGVVGLFRPGNAERWALFKTG